MPTPRAAAAFRYLMKPRPEKKAKDPRSMYNRVLDLQKTCIEKGGSLNISSYDLFANRAFRGIKCGMFPHLYPRSEFTDTGRLSMYQEATDDDTNRVVSIGQSWTRKVLSSVRVCGEHRDLAFFLYERSMANKFFASQHISKRMGITADVLTRDSQTSTGYWDVVQDALADLVRVMLLRCYDEQHYQGWIGHIIVLIYMLFNV